MLKYYLAFSKALETECSWWCGNSKSHQCAELRRDAEVHVARAQYNLRCAEALKLQSEGKDVPEELHRAIAQLNKRFEELQQPRLVAANGAGKQTGDSEPTSGKGETDGSGSVKLDAELAAALQSKELLSMLFDGLSARKTELPIYDPARTADEFAKSKSHSSEVPRRLILPQ